MFRWLDGQLASGKWELTRAELENYSFEGERIPLLDRNRGIRNPADFTSSLTVMTSAKGHPYEDAVLDGGMIRYSYRAQDGGDNKKLVAAFQHRDPIVYFQGIRNGVYVAHYPVYIVENLPEQRCVMLAVDEIFRFFGDPLKMTGDARRYSERITRARLHQPLFRARVMHAYEGTCAVCSLKHAELLDAAHIVGDLEDGGLAIVQNGLALCKIHHAAYDRNLLGITPDYEVRIDRDLLDEVDGPMLRHGLQDMHRRALSVPQRKVDWPDRHRLAARFEQFNGA
ncbi:HNH endonuclease [Rathayibacter sp. KR2-224]|uniref:HNH endonuclease n=1 Tax=Rathayibacter sp. KR2-224 TaxID=3400913 RepID=UPI003C080346